MNRNNFEIITGLKSGNESYFDSIYKEYFPILCAYATQYISREEAKGVVQETMLWLWENRSSLIPEMSLKSLLFTIVKNKSLNKISSNTNKQELYQKIAKKFEAEFNDPDFYFENELMELFEAALARLPEDYRQAFEMNRMEGLTHKEIASKLNVSPQTVNYRIGQALKILRVELKDYLPILFVLMNNN